MNSDMVRSHREKHFTASDLVRDIVIGMSDGLTVPFAIAAGMTGAAVDAKLVIIAGLAEIAAGSISMGLGGYLAGRSDVEHYDVERQREEEETRQIPEVEAQEVADILNDLGLSQEEAAPVVTALRRQRDKWVDFMMRFELGLERPNPRRAWQSAVTIAASYAVSGFIPLSPYMVVPNIQSALLYSVTVTILALFIFGYIKGRITGVQALRSALQTALIGGVAAGAAFGLARWLG
jgi:VIT1/CCC1 family predicted Fe2+/Mn2+ transporter